MILADTGAIIACWRRPSPAHKHILNNFPVAFCGITRAELYVGARSELEIEAFSNDLSLLNEIPIDNAIWEVVGRNLQLLRTKGFTVPFTDVVISSVALQHDFEIWTYDAHFKMIQTVIPKLRLFQEPVINP